MAWIPFDVVKSLVQGWLDEPYMRHAFHVARVQQRGGMETGLQALWQYHFTARNHAGTLYRSCREVPYTAEAKEHYFGMIEDPEQNLTDGKMGECDFVLCFDDPQHGTVGIAVELKHERFGKFKESEDELGTFEWNPVPVSKVIEEIKMDHWRVWSAAVPAECTAGVEVFLEKPGNVDEDGKPSDSAGLVFDHKLNVPIIHGVAIYLFVSDKTWKSTQLQEWFDDKPSEEPADYWDRDRFEMHGWGVVIQQLARTKGR